MEHVINPLRQLAADPGNTPQVIDSGPANTLHAAEMLYESLAALGTDPCDLLERRPVSRIRPRAAVRFDRKTVRFIADML